MAETGFLSSSVGPISAAPGSGPRIAARVRRAEDALAAFCEANRTSPIEMRRGGSVRVFRMRRRFLVQLERVGVGCVLAARLLDMHYSTVLYHRSPEMQARKKQQRAERDGRRKQED